MKFLVFLLVAVAWANADVSHVVNDERYAPVVRNDYEISPEGAYRYVYETGNGIFGRAAAVVTNPNTEYASLQVKGDYRYPAPDGRPVELTYIADENGFQPQGAHLPVPPPIPEAILRGLAYIAAHPPQQEPGRKF